ncbi:MAG TPA: hypothetical protein VK034_29505, partial [Enhygromyxa sp.]|nr:hypothetical protein [Enhygromyxa sp.]
MTGEDLLALDVLGLLDPGDQGQLAALEARAAVTRRDRAELEQAASLLASAVEPIAPPPGLRERLLAELGGRERFAPFVDRV